MTILLTNFFLCLLYAMLAWFCRLKFKTRNLDKIFLGITFLQLIFVHSFIDPLSVPDLPSYQDEFYGKIKFYFGEESILSNLFGGGSELGFRLLSFMCSAIFNNFTIFLLIISVIIIGTYYRMIKKYSPYIFISVLLFLLTVFNQSLFVLRQHLAIAICLFAIPSILERRHIKFLIIVFIAFLFHRTALIFLPIYYLYGINNKIRLLVIMIVTFVILMILSENLFDLVVDNVNRYSNYEGEHSIITYFLPLVVLIFYVFCLKSHVFDDGINKLVFILLILAFAISAAFVKNPGIGRLNVYYTCITILALPIALKFIKTDWLKVFSCFCIILLYFLQTFLFGDTISYRYMELLIFIK